MLLVSLAKTRNVMPGDFLSVRLGVAVRTRFVPGELNDSLSRLDFNFKFLAALLAAQFPETSVHSCFDVKSQLL